MKAFLANVMDAYVYSGDQLLFTSKALTDSSISIGITAEEIRGGKGNKLIGRYFHDSSFGLELQDALFELGYIAHNVGSQVVTGTNGALTEEQVVASGAGALSVSGTPYDTLHSTIGLGGKNMGDGTLADFGVHYAQVDLTENDALDYDAIEESASDTSVRMVYIQRSRGYSLRHTISVDEIKKVCEIVHRVNKRAIVMVDNCYGEFTEKLEPTEVGADLMAGSLIKNAGGGIASCGGYIAGRKDLVELCGYRLTTPGLGIEVGATLGQNRSLFMGLFNAPHVVGEALKTAVFAASIYTELGFKVTPTVEETRHDIIQAICLETPENLIAFCQGLQKGAPVDSYVTPEPWDMPGYDNQVIMSAGAFTSGSSIELSADAPLREPYAVWMQGGLNFHSGKIGVMLATEELLKRGLIK